MRETLHMESKRIKCDACGKNLTMEGENKEEVGPSVIMFSLEARSKNEKEAIFMKEFMGPYDINRAYNICGECVLKTFGVKPYNTDSLRKELFQIIKKS